MAQSVPLFLGRSAHAKSVRDFVKRVARSKSATVLVTGESGTGKEVVARSIHAATHGAARPFVPVNCAALPDTLFESELFGTRPGAFTDSTERLGTFEQASGGTLFLDEIALLPLALQAKLLRVIEDKEVRPLGGSNRRIDIRIVAATNARLTDRVAAGTFREDLFYRLKGLRLHILPLRERREDIPDLGQAFLEMAREATGRRAMSLSVDALEWLQTQDWPGNARDVKGLMEQLAIFVDHDVFEPLDLVHRHTYDAVAVPSNSTGLVDDVGVNGALPHAIEVVARLLAQDLRTGKRPFAGVFRRGREDDAWGSLAVAILAAWPVALEQVRADAIANEGAIGRAKAREILQLCDFLRPAGATAPIRSRLRSIAIRTLGTSYRNDEVSAR